MFLDYLKQEDFVGADMAKKYLHMGFTRARRYWNHSSGKKWTRENGKWEILPKDCLLYTSPSPRDLKLSRMPSSA